MNNKVSLLTTLVTALLLSACTDGTGGGAGDTDDDPDAVALITPFVGLYDLPDNWMGAQSSEAFLEIQAPTASGVATTLVLRVDSSNNCIEPRPSSGKVTKDPFNDRVFLDAFDFGLSVISLADSSLTINLSEDVQDIDDDGNFTEPNTLQAIRIDMMASDLQTCQ